MHDPRDELQVAGQIDALIKSKMLFLFMLLGQRPLVGSLSILTRMRWTLSWCGMVLVPVVTLVRKRPRACRLGFGVEALLLDWEVIVKG